MKNQEYVVQAESEGPYISKRAKAHGAGGIGKAVYFQGGQIAWCQRDRKSRIFPRRPNRMVSAGSEKPHISKRVKTHGAGGGLMRVHFSLSSEFTRISHVLRSVWKYGGNLNRRAPCAWGRLEI